MILQSKMNTDFNGYEIARKYLESLPLDTWVFLNDVPEEIKTKVIVFLDNGHRPNITSVFDECFEKFLLTRRVITQELTLNLHEYHRPLRKSHNKAVMLNELQNFYFAMQGKELKIINHAN